MNREPPVESAAPMPPPSGLRMPRVVRTKDEFLVEAEAITDDQDRTSPLFGWGQVDDLRRRIGLSADRIQAACRRRGGSPGDLPARSRRAYALLRFLASDDQLEAHLDTLARLRRLDGRVAARLDHCGGLYRIERSKVSARIIVSEGFVGAPPPVVEALVRLAAPYARRGRHRAVVHVYADGDGYAAVLRAVEASGGSATSATRGEVYDLAEVYCEVNRTWFGGQPTPPRLAWTERPTRVEFGHYEPSSDTVRLSRSLDSREVPRFVVEHVMHHELLHRELGAERASGRRRYHTPRFRKAEAEFPRLAEAEAFLRRLGARLWRRP